MAFRLPAIYRFMLLFKSRRPGKKFDVTDEYRLVILCGPAQLAMLHECLKSIYRSFSKLPQLFLFADLNLSGTVLKKKTSWFPAKNITIINGLDCINYHQEKQNNVVASFAQKNPMGLKLAAILQVADMGLPVLYCDTDVLWFADPLRTVRQYCCNENFDLAMSEDFQPAYDSSLVAQAGLELLKNPPYFCAGILLFKKLSAEGRTTMAKLLELVINRSDHFSEQTIFAWMNRNSQNNALDKHKFLIKIADQYDLKPARLRGVVARHYIGPVRHLFWRDALWLK